MKIPSNYLPVMPYLILKNAKAFNDFAREVFTATEQQIVLDETGQVMHGEIKIHEAVIMFANANADWGIKTAGMYLYVDDVKKVYDAALINKAESLLPPEQKEYGYTAGFEDPFGNHWWIVEGEK